MQLASTVGRITCMGWLIFSLIALSSTARSATEEPAAIIEQVRQQALAYDENLPNFICTQETLRSSLSAKPNSQWKLLDTLIIRLSYFGRKEDYRVVQVNGKPTNKALTQLGGWKTAGDFGSILHAIFGAKSQARLEWQPSDVWNGRTVAVIGFHVDREHSEFRTTSSNLLHSTSATWAAQGTVYADLETKQIVKLNLDSVDIPGTVPVREVHITMDYANQKIGDREYLLPARSESITVTANERRKSESRFTEYRKFATETAIKFGEQSK